MKKKTLLTALLGILAVVLGLGVLAYNHLNPSAEEQAQSSINTNSSNNTNNANSSNNTNRAATSNPPTDNGMAVAFPDAPQAPGTPEPTPTYKTQTITQPTPKEDLNRDNPEEVAKEALTLFTSRTSLTDTTYQEQLQPITTQELHSELAAMPIRSIADKYPTAVQNVEIKDNIKEWGIDTPARYSHYATAKVATETKGTLEIQYRVAAIKTPQDGWTITDLTIDSYKVLTDPQE